MQLSSIDYGTYVHVACSLSPSSHQADVWLYNLADEINLKLKVKMEQICEWQAARAGLLHHLLAQKMGLFQHTLGRDIQRCTKVSFFSLSLSHCEAFSHSRLHHDHVH